MTIETKTPNVEYLKEQLLEQELLQAQARTASLTTESKLLAEVENLRGCTQSILNAKEAAALYILVDTKCDEQSARFALALVKDALKAARESYKK